jgi:hypothetical protein
MTESKIRGSPFAESFEEARGRNFRRQQTFVNAAKVQACGRKNFLKRELTEGPLGEFADQENHSLKRTYRATNAKRPA